jgi:predicted secreted protein
MAQKDGKFILFKFGNTTYSGQTETEMTIDVDEIDVTTKSSSNGAKEFLPGEHGFSITFSGLQAIDGNTDVSQLITDVKAKTIGAFVWGSNAVGSINITGNGFLTNISLTGTKNEGQGYSGTFRVTGDTTEVVVS